MKLLHVDLLQPSDSQTPAPGLHFRFRSSAESDSDFKPKSSVSTGADSGYAAAQVDFLWRSLNSRACRSHLRDLDFIPHLYITLQHTHTDTQTDMDRHLMLININLNLIKLIKLKRI